MLPTIGSAVEAPPGGPRVSPGGPEIASRGIRECSGSQFHDFSSFHASLVEFVMKLCTFQRILSILYRFHFLNSYSGFQLEHVFLMENCVLRGKNSCFSENQLSLV